MKNILKFIPVLIFLSISTSFGYSQESAVISQPISEPATNTDVIKSCPQFMPLSPDLCSNGEWISGGVDENGCQKPPVCTGKTVVSQSCPAGCVCENGVKACSSSNGEPIPTEIEVKTNVCPENCNCSGALMICSSQTDIGTSEVAPISSPSSQNQIEAMPSSVSQMPITIEKSSDSVQINIQSTQIHSQETVSVMNSQLVISSLSGQVPVTLIQKEDLMTLLKVDKVDDINLTQVNSEPSYVVKASKQVKVLFMVPASMNINATIDAVSGLVTEIKKPWWNFLAS